MEAIGNVQTFSISNEMSRLDVIALLMPPVSLKLLRKLLSVARDTFESSFLEAAEISMTTL